MRQPSPFLARHSVLGRGEHAGQGAVRRGPYTTTARTSARPLDETDASTSPLSWPLPTSGHAELPLPRPKTARPSAAQRKTALAFDATWRPEKAFPRAGAPHAQAPEQRARRLRTHRRGTAPGRSPAGRALQSRPLAKTGQRRCPPTFGWPANASTFSSMMPIFSDVLRRTHTRRPSLQRHDGVLLRRKPRLLLASPRGAAL